jgi:hypothetical protein
MIIVMEQFPLHLYSVFALRSASQGFLTGDPENSWGFGQTVALVMVGQILVACCHEVHGTLVTISMVISN